MDCCVIFCAAEFDAPARPLEKDDYIIAADGGLKHTRKLGIEPNETIGDFGIKCLKRRAADIDGPGSAMCPALLRAPYPAAPAHLYQRPLAPAPAPPPPRPYPASARAFSR